MTSEKKKTGRWWKIYFIGALIFSLPTYMTQEYSRFWEFFDALYFAFAGLGMWGFCWNKHLFGKFFWQVFFWADLVWNILYAYAFPLPPNYDEILQGILTRPVLATVTMLVFMPMTIALYLFAYSRPEIWDPPSAKPEISPIV